MKSEKQQCSLQKNLQIVPGKAADFDSLAEYHYKGHKRIGYAKIFVIQTKNDSRQPVWNRLKEGPKRPIGVILYSMPMPHVAARNVATNNRYVEFGDRQLALAMINREIRTITRVIIHPQYRGVGLAHWLVRQTLPLAGTPLVEAIAVMGRVNPFFEKAGMKRYDQPIRPDAVRLIEALKYAGIKHQSFADTQELLRQIEQLKSATQQFVKNEIQKYTTQYDRHGKKQTIEKQAEIIEQRLFARPVYYLWSRP